MSEEQTELQEQEHKTCICNKIFAVLSIVSLFFSIAALTTSIFALNNGGSTEGKKVVISKQYDKGRSIQKAMDTNKPMIVFFYTDWCGFCQRFVPTFDKITKMSKIRSNFAVAYVNCEKPENQNIVQEYGVHGFPTVFVVDEQGRRTQLENNTFFNDDTKEVVSKKMLSLIGIE